MRNHLLVWLLACLACILTGTVYAQEQPPLAVQAGGAAVVEQPSCPSPSCADEEFEHKKEVFFQVLAGSYFEAHIGPRNTKDYNYMTLAFRVGCRPCEDWGFIGQRTSVMLEGLIAPVYGQYGNLMGGPSILLRFDLLDPHGALVPYIQGGTGFVLDDGYHDPAQRGLGEAFEFLQQVAVGVRWKVSSNVSVFAEGGLQHISNASLATRNFGVNGLGGSVGIEWRH
jgi:Lipid A 3-O-deacylase (PagL)